MPTAGFFTQTFTDYDGENSAVRGRTTVLTAANFDAQATARSEFIAALAAMTLGLNHKYTFGTEILNNLGRATAEEAQRELKWLVSYHDGTTLKGYSMEIPCANTARLDPNDRAHAEIGDGAEVDAFVTEFQSYFLTPDGNSPIVDEITLVGRPL